MSGSPPEKSKEHKLLSQVFHLISQPMTALQCSLEFALNTFQNPDECRTWLEAALENCERLRCRLALAREIADAENAGDPTETTDLRSVLEEVLSDAEPLLEGATPHLHCDNKEVVGRRSRLLRAFFYVLQQLTASNRGEPTSAEVWVECTPELIEVRLLRFVLRENLNKDQVASQLQIAKETFESVGGGLIFFCFAGNDALVRVFLRAPQAQLGLYDQTTGMGAASESIGRTARFPQVS